MLNQFVWVYIVIPIWWCSCFFPGRPLPKLIILKSSICPFAHATSMMRPSNPGKKFLVQHYFPLVYKCPATGKQFLSCFSWGVSAPEHICTSNPRKKMIHDCLRGYGSLHEFTRLGTRIFCAVAMLDIHRSDIRKGIFPSTLWTQVAGFGFVCNEVTPPTSILIGTIISAAALLILLSWPSSSERKDWITPQVNFYQ